MGTVVTQKFTPMRPDWHHGDEPPGGGAWDTQDVIPQLWSCAHDEDDDAVLRNVGSLSRERQVLSSLWDRMSGSTLYSQNPSHPERATSGSLLPNQPCNNQTAAIGREG